LQAYAFRDTRKLEATVVVCARPSFCINNGSRREGKAQRAAVARQPHSSKRGECSAKIWILIAACLRTGVNTHTVALEPVGADLMLEHFAMFQLCKGVFEVAAKHERQGSVRAVCVQWEPLRHKQIKKIKCQKSYTFGHNSSMFNTNKMINEEHTLSSPLIERERAQKKAEKAMGLENLRRMYRAFRPKFYTQVG
jgi:hypothetical protein